MKAFWLRYTTLTPMEVIENRYPLLFADKVRADEQNIQSQKLWQERRNATKATTSCPSEVELMNLEDEYRCGDSKMTAEEYDTRYNEILNNKKQAE